MTKEEKSEYNRQWYLANRDSELRKSRYYNKTHKDTIKKISAGLAKRNRDYINLQKQKPCMDCKGTFPPCAMEFDHRDRTKKYDAVGNLASSHWSLEKIQTEIDKCDLVCSNCHRIRTYAKKHFLPIAA